MSTYSTNTPPVAGHRPVSWVFWSALAFFFVSGGCGLLYQVVWTRKLVLLFGTTPYAVSTVLSIFFLGLGLGSWWGGRLADRCARPLKIYALFEIVIGLWAVLFIFLIGYGESGVVALLQAFTFSHAMGIVLRGGLALVFLLLPVTLMGATLPLLAKAVTSGPAVRGGRIGALYAVNTLGAVTGCALTGFVLIEQYGYARTTFLGAIANVLIGLIAWRVDARLRPAAGSADASATGKAAASAPEPPVPAYARRLVIAAFAVSGFCFLALEVLWTRLLTIVFLGTTYAFTTMLTTLLCGIAVGSLVSAPISDRARHRVSLFGIIQVLMGISCVAVLALFVGLPDRLGEWQRDVGYNWEGMVQAKFALSFWALFLPTFLSGMTFPIAVKAVAAGRDTVGGHVGRLYSANTFGGVLGALAGGYALIPLLGTHRGILLMALILVGAGALLLILCPTRTPGWKGLWAVALAALMVGAFRIAPADVGRAVNQWYIPEDQSILHYDEGIEGTVVVSAPNDKPDGSDRVLWINAVQATTSIEKGVKMNRFEGVLPMLFNRTPREALFMCFGSGITAGTLGLSDFEHIDAVEISRGVLEAAPLFKTDNLDVLNNPKLHFIVDDGRNFLLTTKNRYDVITFEPMPLAMAGVSTFYTTEYYRLCLEHLTPGGLVSQWVPLHSLSPELVRSLTYTFTQVFPEYCAWFINSDLFLIGSNQPLKIDYALARQRLTDPALHQALAPVDLADPIELLSCFFMTKSGVEAFAQGGVAMTDDRPWAEFLAPRLVYERKVPEALKQLLPHFESPLALLDAGGLPEPERNALEQALTRRYDSHRIAYEGVMQFYSGPMSNPELTFVKALEVDGGDLTAQHYLKDIALARTKLFIQWDQRNDAISALEQAIHYIPDDLELHLTLADVYYEGKDLVEAKDHYIRYAALGGTQAQALARERKLAQNASESTDSSAGPAAP